MNVGLPRAATQEQAHVSIVKIGYPQIANAMFALVRPIVPVAAEAFLDYNFGGVHLTRLEVEAIRAGKPLGTENKRENAEWEEKRKKLGM